MIVYSDINDQHKASTNEVKESIQKFQRVRIRSTTHKSNHHDIFASVLERGFNNGTIGLHRCVHKGVIAMTEIGRFRPKTGVLECLIPTLKKVAFVETSDVVDISDSNLSSPV